MDFAPGVKTQTKVIRIRIDIGWKITDLAGYKLLSDKDFDSRCTLLVKRPISTLNARRYEEI
jgi:hypothetical protein